MAPGLRNCIPAVCALVLAAGCVGRAPGEAGQQGFTTPSPPPLGEVERLPRSGSSDHTRGDAGRAVTPSAAAAPAGETDRLATELRALEEEMARMKPGVDRLLEIENDIRILLGQLAALSDAGASGPAARNEPQPLQPLSPEMNDAPAPDPVLEPLAAPEPPGEPPTPPAPPAFTPLEPSPLAPAPIPTAPPAEVMTPLEPPADVVPFDPPTLHPAPVGPIATNTLAPVREPEPEPVAVASLNLDLSPFDAPPPLASAPPVAGGASAVAAALAPEPFADEPFADASFAAAPAPAPAPPPGDGAFFVHLASYRNDAAAMAGWAILSAQADDLLHGLTARVTDVDLGERGVFYRLHAGPIVDRSDAAALCDRLQSRALYCDVARLTDGS